MINKVLQIKILINKQICKDRILRLQQNLFSTNHLNKTTNLHKYSFDDNYLPSIEEKVNFLDQHIMIEREKEEKPFRRRECEANHDTNKQIRCF
jgi:hypothetical protein